MDKKMAERDINLRWYTKKQKGLWLIILEAERELGHIDDGAWRGIRKLNAIDGVCTRSCCFGHKKRAETPYISVALSKAKLHVLGLNLVKILAVEPGNLTIEIYTRDYIWVIVRFKNGSFEKVTDALVAVLKENG